MPLNLGQSIFDIIGIVATQEVPLSLPFPSLIFQLLMDQHLQITRREAAILTPPPGELQISFYPTQDRAGHQIMDIPYVPPRTRMPPRKYSATPPPGVGSSARATRSRAAQKSPANASRKGNEKVLDS